jgi:hypothetical protein
VQRFRAQPGLRHLLAFSRHCDCIKSLASWS